jgi:uncharacterized protein (TIGR03067 family)
MRHTITALVAVAAAGWAAAGAQDEAAKEAKRLEGTYEVVEVLTGGKPDPKGGEVKSFEIKGGTITIKLAMRDEVAKFTLDPSKKPAHIDIAPGKADKPIQGIYETKETDKGLELTIAFQEGGAAERPKDFKGTTAKDVVVKLLRKKEK